MRRLVLSALLVLAGAACSKAHTNASPTGAAPTGAAASEVSMAGDTVVATIESEKVTAAELDGKISDELGESRTEYIQKVHDLRRGALEMLLAEKLIAKEAKARGMDEKALMKAEVEDKVAKPDEAAIQKFYDTQVAPNPQFQGATLDVVRGQVERQLSMQAMRTRYGAYLDELKTKYKSKVTLPPPNLPRENVEATGPSRGPANAKVTIVAFSDFQCPYCSRAAATLGEVEKAYEGKVRVVFRHYPLPFHAQAPKAAEASACAADQGKFWEMHDALFAHQNQLEPESLKTLAHGVAGIDAAKFDTCLDGGSKAAVVQADMEAGQKAHVKGTPAFFINGIALSGAQPLEAFKNVIDNELAAK